MTERLYYADATQTHFTGCVVGVRPDERGVALRLDRTAFYPTSGGQPHDTGTLAGIPVLDVWEDDAGEIWHLLPSGAPAVGESVEGRVDWPRRFDHMQQHSGQHLLSAACVDVLGAETLSFHLGSESSTIDVALPQLSWEDAGRVEARVNAMVWEDAAVHVDVVSPADLASFALRKPPQVAGDVRVVSIGECDVSACGGTHVPRAGAVGLVKITGIERYKGGVRITFLCGGRALRDYRRVSQTLRQLSLDLTVGQDDVPDAVARVQDELRATRRALVQAREERLAYEADRLWEIAPDAAGVRRVVSHVAEATFEDVRAMASRMQSRPRTFVLLAVTDEKGVRVVCARSEDLPAVDAGAILRAALAPLEGRGGGTAAMAQGGAPLRPAEAVAAALEGALAQLPGVQDSESNGG